MGSGEVSFRDFGLLLVRRDRKASPLTLERCPPTSFYLVTNAGRSDVDIPWIKKQVEAWNAENAEKVDFQLLDSAALIALQGRSALDRDKHLSPYLLLIRHNPPPQARNRTSRCSACSRRISRCRSS